MKLAFWILGIVVSLLIASIPEIAMYFVYSIITPTTEFSRVFLMTVFFVFGGGACIFFGIIGFMVFCAITAAVIE